MLITINAIRKGNKVLKPINKHIALDAAQYKMPRFFFFSSFRFWFGLILALCLFEHVWKSLFVVSFCKIPFYHKIHNANKCELFRYYRMCSTLFLIEILK